MSAQLIQSHGQAALLEDLRAVPVPAATQTYRPVPYADVIEMVEQQAQTVLDREIVSRHFGLSRKGVQMFAILTFDMGHEKTGLSIGLRQSYDKSVSLGLCCGARVFVCDNLMFSGSTVRVVRKNTLHVWDDFRMLVDDGLEHAARDYRNIIGDAAVLKAVPMPERAGAEIIGLAQYQGVLRPQQASVAFQDWRKARYPAFKKRNLWSLYNCFTQALKRTPAGLIMDGFSEAHRFFQERVAELPGDVLDRVMSLVEVGQEADADKE